MQSLSVHAIEIVIIIDDVKFHLIPCIISVYDLYKFPYIHVMRIKEKASSSFFHHHCIIIS